MAMVIWNRSWRDRRDWRDRCRRFAWAAQDVAERKDRERREREAYYEAAAEEYMFERHCW